MTLRSSTRNTLAGISRSLPGFRGKASFGKAIGQILTDDSQQQDSVVEIEMKLGHRMILDVRSRTEAWAFWTGTYDDDVMGLIAKIIPDGATVLDVGANVGFYSTALGNHLKNTNGTLFSFEPLTPNFERLEKNIILNNLQGVVRPFKLALGDKDESVQVNLEQTHGSTTGNGVILSGHEKQNMTATETCTVKRLDQIWDEIGIQKCDFIKMDVEGYEYRMIKGATDSLRQHRPIMFGEFNAYWIQQCGDSILDVERTMRSIDYAPYTDSGKQKLEPLSDLKEGQMNVWWIPVEREDDIRERLA